MLQLTTLPQYYIDKYGKDKVAEVIGEKSNVLAMWLSRGSWPLTAVEKLLEFDPEPINAIKPLYTNTKIDAKLAILMPHNTGISGKAIESVMRLYNPNEMRFMRYSFNTLTIARNALAQRFLDSGCTWAFWMDSDMVIPAGDAYWFKQTTGLHQMPDVFAGVNGLMRLLHHQKKLIGCTYFAKEPDGNAQFSGGHDKLAFGRMRYSPADQIRPVDWIGFGGLLMHRDVLLDMIKTQGDEMRVKDPGVKARFGYEYSFFERLPEWTEDCSFCVRAKKAGHQTYVDFSVRAAHIGETCY